MTCAADLRAEAGYKEVFERVFRRFGTLRHPCQFSRCNQGGVIC
jgi:hypothetical protein